MADKAGYLVMIIAEGITVLSACNSFNTQETQISLSEY